LQNGSGGKKGQERKWKGSGKVDRRERVERRRKEGRGLEGEPNYQVFWGEFTEACAGSV